MVLIGLPDGLPAGGDPAFVPPLPGWKRARDITFFVGLLPGPFAVGWFHGAACFAVGRAEQTV